MENIWLAVRHVCVSIATNINPSIIRVIRLGHGSVSIPEHCLSLVPAFSLAPLIFLSLIFNACTAVVC